MVDDALVNLALIAQRSGLPLARWHQLRASAARAVVEGRFQAAREDSAQATELARASGDPVMVGMGFAHSSHLALLRGDVADLPESFWPVFDAVSPMPIMVVARAGLLLLLGRRDEALTAYEHVRGLLDDPVVDLRWGGVLMGLADLVETFDDVELADAVAAQLTPYAAYPGVMGTTTTYFVGSASRDLGRLHAVAGRLAEAQTDLREAVRRNAALGARPHVVLARLDLADVLHRQAVGSGGSGTAAARACALAEAGRLVDDAGAEARRLDMPGALGRADTLTRAVADARRAADPLTSREREVAGLVVQAQSNRAITERLVLSERTVESHVRSILAKLGCTNRTELVARWTREISA